MEAVLSFVDTVSYGQQLQTIQNYCRALSAVVHQFSFLTNPYPELSKLHVLVQSYCAICEANFHQAKFSCKYFSDVNDCFAISKTDKAACFVTDGKSSK